MSRIGIAGWNQSSFQERMEDVNRNELIFTTVYELLEKTGVDIEDIDSIVSASCDTVDGISISSAYADDAMGAFMKEESKVEEDGAYALMYAYHRLLMGQWRNCLIVAHGKSSDAGPAFYANMMCDPFLLRPLGLETISSAALQAAAYYHRYGVSEEDAARVVVKNRAAGKRNPHTQVRSEVSLEEVLRSPYLASPIKQLEVPPVSDGAVAVLLATEDYARQVTDSPVWVDGVGFCQDVYYPGHKELSHSVSCQKAARDAYRQVGIGDPLKELDLAEVSEGFSFQELLLYENLGFCDQGKGARLIQDGTTDFEGAFPVNPSGGTLCANATMVAGLARIIECCRQLTRSAGENQVQKDLNRALAHASSGLFLQSNLVTILSI